MNKIVNKFLLSLDKIMAKMQLRQPIFTYSDSGQFINNKQKVRTFQERADSKLFIKRNQIKRVFNMIWLTENLRIFLKNDEYESGLATMVYKLFDKKLQFRWCCLK